MAKIVKIEIQKSTSANGDQFYNIYKDAVFQKCIYIAEGQDEMTLQKAKDFIQQLKTPPPPPEVVYTEEFEIESLNNQEVSV
jgi:hypothetical protein